MHLPSIPQNRLFLENSLAYNVKNKFLTLISIKNYPFPYSTFTASLNYLASISPHISSISYHPLLPTQQIPWHYQTSPQRDLCIHLHMRKRAARIYNTREPSTASPKIKSSRMQQQRPRQHSSRTQWQRRRPKPFCARGISLC